jgi:hypothetical protein
VFLIIYTAKKELELSLYISRCWWISGHSRYVTVIIFVDRCLFICAFSFGQHVVCSSSIYEFLLPVWYVQTLHMPNVLQYYFYSYLILPCRDRWFSPGSPVSSANKIDRRVMTEILLKVALNTIKQTNKQYIFNMYTCI